MNKKILIRRLLKKKIELENIKKNIEKERNLKEIEQKMLFKEISSISEAISYLRMEESDINFDKREYKRIKSNKILEMIEGIFFASMTLTILTIMILFSTSFFQIFVLMFLMAMFAGLSISAFSGYKEDCKNEKILNERISNYDSEKTKSKIEEKEEMLEICLEKKEQLNQEIKNNYNIPLGKLNDECKKIDLSINKIILNNSFKNETNTFARNKCKKRNRIKKI